jgi:chromosome segregation ATPase
MAEATQKETTNWRQWRVKTNLGTLASILVAIVVLVWQGGQIRAQIDDNSQAVGNMAMAVEELSATVGLTIELDQRTNQLFGEIDGLRDQYQDQADVWVEISTHESQIDTIRDEARILRADIESTWNQQNEFRMEVIERVGEFDAANQTLSDLQWQVDDLNRRVAEAIGMEMAGGNEDYGYQITDLIRQVAELQGRQNAGMDIEWKPDELENSLDWEVEELHRLTDSLFWENDDLRSQIDDLWNIISSLD